MQCLGVTFDLGSVRMCPASISETYFSNHKDIWITATDYYMYFQIIVLYPLKALL